MFRGIKNKAKKARKLRAKSTSFGQRKYKRRVLSLSQLGHVLAVRSDRTFLYKQGIFSNLPLFLSVLATFVLQLGVIYSPFMNNLFKTQPLTLNELILCILISIIVFHAVELEKWIRKRTFKKL